MKNIVCLFTNTFSCFHISYLASLESQLHGNEIEITAKLKKLLTDGVSFDAIGSRLFSVLGD